MVPTITDTHPQTFTVLIEFDVAPDQQHALIAGLADQIEARFRHFSGFVSASFHADDGRRVLNYAQWRSREAWREALAGNSEVDAAVHEVIARCGARTLAVTPFRVARVVENVAA